MGEGESQEARIPDEGGVAPRRVAALPPEPFLKIDWPGASVGQAAKPRLGRADCLVMSPSLAYTIVPSVIHPMELPMPPT